MSENNLLVRIICKHATAEDWQKAVNFTPREAELVVYDPDESTGHYRLKIGDGKTNINGLDFIDSALQNELLAEIAAAKKEAMEAIPVVDATLSKTGIPADAKAVGDSINAIKYTHPRHTAYGTGLYKVEVNTLGHVSSVTAVTKDDITALGIPSENTTYTSATATQSGLMSFSDKSKLDTIDAGANKYSHPTYVGRHSGLYKITVDESGHVSEASAVTKDDIVGLGIPSSDEDTHYISKNVVGDANAIVDTSVDLSNGYVHLNSVENGQVTSSHKITGGGATTVTSDANGNIIITTDSAISQVDIDAIITGAKKYTDSEIAELVGTAPDTLDTIYELASAIKDNDDIINALDNAIADRALNSDLMSHVNNSSNPHQVTLSDLGVNASNASLNYIDGLGRPINDALALKLDNTTTINNKLLSHNPVLTHHDVGADQIGSAEAAEQMAKAYTNSQILAWVGSTTVDEQIQTMRDAISQEPVKEHNHNDIYMDRGSITDALIKKSDITHTHPSYANEYVFGQVKIKDSPSDEYISCIDADMERDALTIIAGDNVRISPDFDSKSITISSDYVDTVYTHPSYSPVVNDILYKHAVDSTGHVSSSVEVTTDDIRRLNITSRQDVTDMTTSMIDGAMQGVQRNLDSKLNAANPVVKGNFTMNPDGTESLGAFTVNTNRSMGKNGVAIGVDAQASDNAVAIGTGSSAGANAFAIGNQARATGGAGFSIGNNTATSGFGATALGVSTSMTGLGGLAIGSANRNLGGIEDSITGVIKSRYLLQVGNGNVLGEEIERSDAMTVDWDGNVRIAGDLYVSGTNGLQGNKLATETMVDNAAWNTLKEAKTYTDNNKGNAFTAIYVPGSEIRADNPDSTVYIRAGNGISIACNEEGNPNAFEISTIEDQDGYTVSNFAWNQSGQMHLVGVPEYETDTVDGHRRSKTTSYASIGCYVSGGSLYSGYHKVAIEDDLNTLSEELSGISDAVTAMKNSGLHLLDKNITGTAVADGDTLRWDGDIYNMPIYTGDRAYSYWTYVSENIPSIEDLNNGYEIYCTRASEAWGEELNGTEFRVSIAPSVYDNGDISFADLDGAYVRIISTPSETFTQAGVYFHGGSGIYLSRFKINGYEFLPSSPCTPLKDKYIPDSVKRVWDPVLLYDANGKEYKLTVGTDGSLSAVATRA